MTKALRQAFKNEVRPDEFMGKITVTAVVALLVLSGLATCPQGQFDLINLMPTGNWISRTPAGGLYIELWATILVNAYQFAFFLWGIVLFGMLIKRILTSNKYIYGCLFLSIMFIGIALALPSCVQSLLQIVIERYPNLVS
ncbi:MAG: hypothetical protein K2W95_10845 [Candidatus Obscuribacterales bacterium]|nr:hypothetical protein [Candidatus Obscuribacterales bacterium]